MRIPTTPQGIKRRVAQTADSLESIEKERERLYAERAALLQAGREAGVPRADLMAAAGINANTYKSILRRRS